MPHDKFSNPVGLCTQDPVQAGFQIDIAGPGGALAANWDLSACEHGELAASYLPVESGACTISIKYKGLHLQGSPHQVQQLYHRGTSFVKMLPLGICACKLTAMPPCIMVRWLVEHLCLTYRSQQ